MTTRDTLSVRSRRLAVQQLESLQRAGLTDLIRRGPSRAEAGIPPDPARQSSEGEPVLGGRGSCRAADETGGIGSAGRPGPVVARVDPPHAAAPAPHVSPSERKSLPVLEQRVAELAVIEREVAACRRCEHLACARTQTVFGVGSPAPRLCFLGEAPGADEDRLGEPFVGRAGQLLTDMIQKGMGLRRSDVYILNVLKCRPPDNRTPTEEEVANCREYFERQLDVLQPEFICCLGATAVRALLHQSQSLGRMRGQWYEHGTARVIVTYHPSYLLRNPAAKKDSWQDLQMLMRAMGLPVPTRDQPS